jgi:hypothetical protein
VPVTVDTPRAALDGGQGVVVLDFGRCHWSSLVRDISRYSAALTPYRNLPEEHDAWHAGGQVTQDYLNHPQ